MLHMRTAEFLLQPLDGGLLNPADLWVHQEFHCHNRFEVSSKTHEHVAAGHHHIVHDQGEHHGSSRHKVLLVGGKQHSVGKVHCGLCAHPLQHPCYFGLEIVETD